MRRRFLRVLPLLALAAALTLAGCGIVVRSIDRAAQGVASVGQPGRHGRLSEQERKWARIAWKYVENNTSQQTGLVSGVERQPVATLWQVGDTLAALVAARQLGLIEPLEFDRRVSMLLAFLNRMPLTPQSLPGAAYQVQSGQLAPAPGAGPAADASASAVDIGRLLTWMKITGELYPQFREYLDKAVLRWSFCPVIDDCGRLRGPGGAPQGRLGYQQYAGAGFALWGFETRRAAEIGPLGSVDLLGVRLSHDARDDRTSGELAPVLATPHVLLGLEFDWRLPGGTPATDARLREMAFDVFRVQEQRYLRQDVLTARGEHATRQPPYRVHDSVFASGYPWNTLSPQGRPHPELALVSTRAVFGMWALWPGAYTDRLMQAVEALHVEDRGWFEGRSEQSGGYEDLLTLSTNAAVLQALLYKVRGPLKPDDGRRGGYFERRAANVFEPLNRCLPAERQACADPATGTVRRLLQGGQ